MRADEQEKKNPIISNFVNLFYMTHPLFFDDQNHNLFHLHTQCMYCSIRIRTQCENPVLLL